MIVQILAALFLLGLVVFFHELGHFLAGKWVGVEPRIFSIGYGKGRWKFVRGRTTYQITAIPLGGYVLFYGDELTEQHDQVKKGDFFSVGPWRRMAIAFGGPAFSVLFGVLVLFSLMLFGWQPVTNEIEVPNQNTYAYEAGLRTGDRILSVNGHRTESYEKAALEVAFAPENVIELKVERENKEITVPVEVAARERGGIRRVPGMIPVNEKAFLIAAEGKVFSGGEIRKKDHILEANGVPLKKVETLRTLLQETDADSVSLSIERGGSLFAPDRKEKITVDVPLQRVEIIELKGLKDLQTGAALPDRTLSSLDPETFTRIYINGENYSLWSDFRNAAEKNSSGKLRIGSVPVSGTLSVSEKKMIGMQFGEGFIPRDADLPRDFFSLIGRSVDQAYFATKSTLLGLYRIIEGKLSFSKSVSGPVKIMAVAAQSVESGWSSYWYLLAQISIILGIMNLLPIPVLDGGHIVFHMIEALYKPVPVQVVAMTMRTGMAILLTFGVYVIAHDIWDVFFRGVLF